MTTFAFETFGFPQAKARFSRMGSAAIDLAPAWAEMLEWFFYIEDETFTSQGRRGGGSWAADTDDWMARKSRDGLDPRINFATWSLYDAMTELGAPGQIVSIEPQRLAIGSDLPQAGPSQKYRPFIKLTETDKFEMANFIKNHFKRAWEAGT